MRQTIEDRLRRVQALRLRLHRLDPPRPLRGARAVAAFVRERRIVLEAGQSSLPNLAEAIAGRRLKGSWMAHPEADCIYTLLRALSRLDFLAVPLITGKQTILDPVLAPDLERVASDPARREQAIRRLSSLARRLLGDVESAGSVRMDTWSVPTQEGRAARRWLERELLVATRRIHTIRGYHTAILMPWRLSAISRRFGGRAARLSSPAAQEMIWLSAIRSAVLAPEREARRWFAFGNDGLDRLVATGKVERIAANAVVWLRCSVI